MIKERWPRLWFLSCQVFLSFSETVFARLESQLTKIENVWLNIAKWKSAQVEIRSKPYWIRPLRDLTNLSEYCSRLALVGIIFSLSQTKVPQS